MESSENIPDNTQVPTKKKLVNIPVWIFPLVLLIGIAFIFFLSAQPTDEQKFFLNYNVSELQGEACYQKMNDTLTAEIIPPTFLKYNKETNNYHLIIHCYDPSTSEEHNYWVAIFCKDKTCTDFKMT